MSSFDSASRQLVAKKEVTRGTYLAPTYASDFNVKCLEVGDPSFDFGHDGGVNVADGKFGLGKSYSGKKQSSISFQCDMNWSGTLATAPKWFKFMEGCGFVTDTGGAAAISKWTGRPECVGMSFHLPVWSCGNTAPSATTDIIAGAAGTVSFGAEGVGMPVRMAFEFTGKYGGRIDETQAFTAPSGFDTADCEVHLGTTVTVGGAPYKAWVFNFALGGELQSVDDPADLTNAIKTGILYYKLGNVKPQLTVSKLRSAVSSNNPIADVTGNTVFASIVIELTHFTVTLSGAQPIEIAAAVANESMTDDITFKIDTVEIKQKA